MPNPVGLYIDRCVFVSYITNRMGSILLTKIDNYNTMTVKGDADTVAGKKPWKIKLFLGVVMFMKKTVFLLAVIFLATVPSNIILADSSVTNFEDKIMNDAVFYNNIVAGEVRFVQGLMMSNGAIPKNLPAADSSFGAKELPDIDGIPASVYTKWKVGHIVPYFSEIAVLGILKAAPAESKEAVERFVTWYLDSINDAKTDAYGVDGTIYDLYVFQDPTNPKQVVQLPARVVESYRFENPKDNNIDYDSTDSYAALFLRILSEYYHTYNEAQVFENRKDEVDRVLNALLSTYVDKIHLTYAKPSYEVCYLMDNCEVYNGLLAGAEVYEKVYKDLEKSKELSEYAQKVMSGIEKYMWNEEGQYYHSAVFVDGKPAFGMDWNNFYPDATAQLFPILFGLIKPDSERAALLYKKFNDSFGVAGVLGKDWTALDKGDAYPWSTIAHVAGIVGDYARLDRFVTHLEQKYLKTHSSYYYYCGEAGQTLFAVQYMQNPKQIVSVKEESITARIGEQVPLGVSLFPPTALPGRLDVKIEDSAVAAFDRTTGLINPLSEGKTVITISIDKESDEPEVSILLNVVDGGEIPKSEVSKPSNKNGTIALKIVGVIGIIGGIWALVFCLRRKRKL